jgi:eukaryotic-like serine/threonine-protein kinase
MLPDEVRDALSALTKPLSARPELEQAVRDLVDAGDADVLRALLADPVGDVLLAWCAASAGRRDLRLAPLLAAAADQPALHDWAVDAARARVVEGPLLDALACAPLLGDGRALVCPTNVQARARLEILVLGGRGERRRGAAPRRSGSGARPRRSRR